MLAGFEAVLILLGCLTAAAAHSSHRLTHHHEDGWIPQPPAVSDQDPDSQKDENNNIKQDPFSISSQLLVRTTRGNRVYDVPQIECPPAPEEDVMERFACPTPDHMGRYRCIDDHVLCDGFIDCPGGEDEDRQACMFYRTTKAHLDILADALLRWARGR